jgi:hypothetical protein
MITTDYFEHTSTIELSLGVKNVKNRVSESNFCLETNVVARIPVSLFCLKDNFSASPGLHFVSTSPCLGSKESGL